MAINLNNASLRMSAGRPDQFPRDHVPQIALSGRSNVGKSSLVNTLLGRKALARVSSAPGKTITVNFYDVDGALFLVDLPGYGFAKRAAADKAKWSSLTDGYFTDNKNIDLLSAVVQLIDPRAGITADDRMMLCYLNGAGIPYIIAVTKIDKLNKTERGAALEKINSDADVKEGTEIIPFSSLSKEGKNELWSAILKRAKKQAGE